MFNLQFDPKEIPIYAGRYPIEEDQLIESVIAPKVCAKGFFTRTELLEVCRWKTPRSKPLVQSNPQEFVEEVSKTALSTTSERLRIEVLTLLNGVSWPTASVLLHFGHLDPYPILDFRALWSLGVDFSEISYNFVFWRDYTQFCRKLANETGVTMRVLDRALWQYSKENQK